jgi:hypothetical protein
MKMDDRKNSFIIDDTLRRPCQRSGSVTNYTTVMMTTGGGIIMSALLHSAVCIAALIDVCHAQDNVLLAGHTVFNKHILPLPYTYISSSRDDAIPRAFSWHNVNGRSYLTRSLNQHIPQ